MGRPSGPLGRPQEVETRNAGTRYRERPDRRRSTRDNRTQRDSEHEDVNGEDDPSPVKFGPGCDCAEGWVARRRPKPEPPEPAGPKEASEP